MARLRGVFLVAWLGLGLFASTAWAGFYAQVNLVSDIPGFAAITDPNLKNPWGISRSATSPFWVSDQGTNLATLYRVTNGIVSQVALNVAIPTAGGGPQGPTGQVNNNTTAFPVPGAPAASIAASFIFANLNGTIDAWRGSLVPNTSAVTVATTAGAVYTGLAIGDPAVPRLFAANTSQNRVDVFDGAFGLLNLGPKRICRRSCWRACAVRHPEHRQQYLCHVRARRTPGPNRGHRGDGSCRYF
jgi:uncharacterized protein (TIGR03118 family)